MPGGANSCRSALAKRKRLAGRSCVWLPKIRPSSAVAVTGSCPKTSRCGGTRAPTVEQSLIATTTQRKTSSDAITNTQGPEGSHKGHSLRVEERSAPVEAPGCSCGVLHDITDFKVSRLILAPHKTITTVLP